MPKNYYILLPGFSLCNCLRLFFHMGQWFWTEKRLILCICNILLFSLTLIQDTRSWPPLCQCVYLWGTIKVESQTPIKRLLAQSAFCSATQWWTGTFYRLLLFRSLYRYFLSTHYALDNEKIAMNKANRPCLHEAYCLLGEMGKT